jgi:Zn-dependent protease with chaperone function
LDSVVAAERRRGFDQLRAGLQVSRAASTLADACVCWALFAIFNARTLAGRFPLWPLTLWLGAVVLSILIQYAVSRYYIAPAIAPLLLIATLGLAFSGPDLAPGRSGFILTLFGAVALGFATLLRGAPLLKVLTPVDPGRRHIRDSSDASESERPALRRQQWAVGKPDHRSRAPLCLFSPVSSLVRLSRRRPAQAASRYGRPPALRRDQRAGDTSALRTAFALGRRQRSPRCVVSTGRHSDRSRRRL